VARVGADPLPPPPRWLRAALVAALAVLLFYPVHVPYQVSDQDWVPSYSLFELVRGGWAPWNFHYTSALTNLVRLGYAAILGAAHLVGYDLDAVDLLVAWMDHPAAFRVPVRLIGMGAGVLSLIAAMRLGSLVAGPWAGMTAAALLGTAFGFVREHHGGMFDPPAVAAASWSAVAAATYVVRPRLGMLVAAGALAGLAVSFKQSVLVVVLGLPLAAAVATGPARERLAALVAAAGAAGAVLLATSPGLLLDPARFLWHQNLIRQALYSGQPPDEPRALWAVLRRAAGLPLIVAALFGVASAVRRRERALVPVLGPAVLLCASALGATFLMNRYALPLLLPCAVFAAYGLHWSLRSTPLRAAVVALLVAMALPSCISYLRLLAVEDTRVAAARWLAAHVRPGAVVVWSMSTLYSSFYGPDVPARPRLVGLPSAPLAELERKMGGPVVPSYRFVRSWRPRPGCETCAPAPTCCGPSLAHSS
jgi:hypothetical protein